MERSSTNATADAGNIGQDTALDKLRTVVGEDRATLLNKLPTLEKGHFLMAQEGQACILHGERSAMETRQCSEEEILRLAQRAPSTHG